MSDNITAPTAQEQLSKKELDELFCDPAKASDMTLVAEYTDTKRALDEEVERWEKLSEELDSICRYYQCEYYELTKEDVTEYRKDHCQ